MIKKIDGCFHFSGNVKLETVARNVIDGASIFEGDMKEVDIDFSEIISSDSSVVSLMLSWFREAKRRGLVINYRNLGDSEKSLIKLYGLDGILPVSE